MSQVTYTVGVLDDSAALVYKGILQVQLDLGTYRSTPTAGLLALPGFEPLLMSGRGSGGSWGLSGDNGSLSVSLYVDPTGQQANQAPPYFTGSIALTAAGQQEQRLLLLGYTGGSAAPVANMLGADNAAAADAVAAAGPGVTDYNWTLALLDESFARTGTAAFTGSGRMMQTGPTSRRWMITGTLTGDGFPAGGIPMQGGGVEDYWYGRSERDPHLTLAVGAKTYVQGVSAGTLARSNGTSFFVGMPVAQSTIPVPTLAHTAAEPA
jgi:hypothetical protein